MSWRDDVGTPGIGAILVIVAVLLILSFGCRWAWATWQGSVWRKQGVDISNAEVFFGIKPAGTPSR